MVIMASTALPKMRQANTIIEHWIEQIELGNILPLDGFRYTYEEMQSIGFIPDNVNHGGDGSSSSNIDGQQIIDAILNATSGMNNDLFRNIQDSIIRANITNTNIINNQFVAMRNDVNNQIAQQNQLNNQQTQEILQAIDTIQNTSSNSLEPLIDDIQQMFLNNDNRVQQHLDNLRMDVQSIVNDSLNGVEHGIRELGLAISDIDTTTASDSGWNEGLIVDLLGILETFRTDMLNKDMSPIIENNIDLSGLDDSASIGGGVFDGSRIPDPIALGAYLGQLLNNDIGNEIGGVGDRIESIINIFNKAITNQYSDYNDMIQDFNNISGTGTVTDIILKGLLFIPTILSGIIGATQPFVNNIETLARTQALDGLLPPDTLRELYIRKLIDRNTYNQEFSKLGFDANDSARFIETSTIQLPDFYIREAFLRGIITQSQHDEYMVRLGYLTQDLNLIRKTYFRIPPVPDLIRFAVREAYDENLAQALQLDSGYDVIKDRFEKDLQQNGLDASYGKLYWRSHWDLPSPSQAYEMLHRGEITKQELEQLLRVSDYSPEWIDKLVNISYKPYTRVDIRRMHKVGVLGGTEVIQAYKDLGYDIDKAVKLAQFTIKLNEDVDIEKDKDLSQSSILRAYKVNLLDRNTAKTMLIQHGYNDRESNILLDMQDLGVTVDNREDVISDNRRRIVSSVSKSFIEGALSEQSARFYFASVNYLPEDIDIEIQTLKHERNILLQRERIENVMKGYIEFRLDENGVRSALANEGYTGIEENDLFALWNTQRKDRFSNPTKAELKRWYVAGHITTSECANYLRGMGYDNKLVDLYLQEMIDSKNSST